LTEAENAPEQINDLVSNMNILVILRFLTGFWFSNTPRHRRAGVALMVGLTSPVLIGMTGFAVDASFWVSQHTTLQTATDAAAFKAARDLATTPSTSAATLASDALAAANQAVAGQMTLTASDITVSQLTDDRQVKVTASVAGDRFFSQVYYPFPVTITTSSTAGVAYPLVSNQATCFAADSYMYLYSTGFGTFDTAHSAGLDSFTCGSAPNPPAVYNSYCGGGVLGCSLDILNAGNVLLPFAIQIEPSGGTYNSAGLLLTPVIATLGNLLTGSSYAGGGTMTYVGPTSSGCSNNSCTIRPGVYNGGLTIESGVTANFASGTYLIENGNLAISTQAKINQNNAIFYFSGASPGGYVQYSQVIVNTAPLNAGSIEMTSNANFSSSSIIGTQTSSPLSVAPYAQSYASTQGLLSTLGLPGQNLAGTNFVSAIGVCPHAASTCASPQNQSAITQSTIIPSLSGLATLLPALTPADLILGQTESSLTSVTSGVTYANGVPTDWFQADTATSTLANTHETSTSSVLSLLGLSNLLSPVVSPILNPILAAIAPSVTNTQATSASGTFAGQTSTGAPSCAGGQPILYSGPLISTFGAGATDILQTAGSNGGTTNLAMSDSIIICGTTPSGISSITPLGSGSQLVSSTAAGASALYLLQ
jgi:Flp pilus assembly protein TadG